LKKKIIDLWEKIYLLDPEKGVCFDRYSEKVGWRCSVEYGTPIRLVEGYGKTPEDALDKLTKKCCTRNKGWETYQYY
jgi:hypothetical protein